MKKLTDQQKYFFIVLPIAVIFIIAGIIIFPHFVEKKEHVTTLIALGASIILYVGMKLTVSKKRK